VRAQAGEEASAGGCRTGFIFCQLFHALIPVMAQYPCFGDAVLARWSVVLSNASEMRRNGVSGSRASTRRRTLLQLPGWPVVRATLAGRLPRSTAGSRSC
jgi:hypothetical protein